METLQGIKKRIAGIESTRQITRSMRLVSTSKAQRVRSRMSANQPFLEESVRLIRIACNEAGSRHPYVAEREGLPAAIVVIAGDRGLCGGYNVGANRMAADLISWLQNDVRLVTIGSKARDYFRRRYSAKLAQSFTGISETPFYEDAAEIAMLLLKWYDRREVGEIQLVYTRFHSMLSHEPFAERLLPVQLPEEKPPAGPVALVRCEPGGGAFLKNVVPFYLTSRIFGAILESSCCEQSARITSMDSAVNNADEMISGLTLRYNQARQSAITQEITEIVAGADAV